MCNPLKNILRRYCRFYKYINVLAVKVMWNLYATIPLNYSQSVWNICVLRSTHLLFTQTPGLDTKREVTAT